MKEQEKGKNCVLFFKKVHHSLPRQHWAAIGCTESVQPKGMTVHSDLLQG